MTVAMTKKELAEIAGYTYRRLYDIDRELPDEKKLFVQSEGSKCDLAIFVRRWAEYNAERAAGDDADLDEVKARHEQVKMEKTQLEVDRMKGSLVLVEDVKKLWGDVIDSVRKNLLQLGNRIAPRIVMMGSADVISGIIEAEIHKALQQIADTPLPYYAAVVNGDEDGDEE